MTHEESWGDVAVEIVASCVPNQILFLSLYFDDSCFIPVWVDVSGLMETT